MASIVFPVTQRQVDNNGKPLNNAKIRVWDAGTNDLADVYSDKALSSALTQPIRTNSGGFPITSGGTPCLIYVRPDFLDCGLFESRRTPFFFLVICPCF